jgi:hypothetical protein
MVAKSHAGTGCQCGACQSYGGEFRPISKTQIKKLNASNAQLLAALQATLNQLDTVCAAIVWPAFGLPDARTTDSYKLARTAIASATDTTPVSSNLMREFGGLASLMRGNSVS